MPQPFHLGGVCTVHAVFADGGQNLIEHPALELFRTGQLRVGDEPVQVAFGEKVHLLFSPIGKGVAFHDPLAMAGQRVVLVLIPQRLAGIRTTEQRLSILIQDAYAAKRGVGVGL